MRCSDCYARTDDEYMHRLRGECRATANESQDRPAWQRPRKVREHSGPWPSAKHGTRSRYQRGCHCDDCVAANNAYMAAWRARRSA